MRECGLARGGPEDHLPPRRTPASVIGAVSPSLVTTAYPRARTRSGLRASRRPAATESFSFAAATRAAMRSAAARRSWATRPSRSRGSAARSTQLTTFPVAQRRRAPRGWRGFFERKRGGQRRAARDSTTARGDGRGESGESRRRVAAAPESARALSSLPFKEVFKSLSPRSSRSSKRSSRSTTSSAACDGVAARRSAARSASVTSTS